MSEKTKTIAESNPCEISIDKLDQEIKKKLEKLGQPKPLNYKWVGVGKDGSQTKVGGGDKMGDFVFTGESGNNVKVGVQLSNLSDVEVFEPKDNRETYNRMIKAGKCIYETPLAKKIKDNKTCSLAIGTKYMWVGLLKTDGGTGDYEKNIFVFKNEADTENPVYYSSHFGSKEAKKGFTDFIMSELEKLGATGSAPPVDETEEEQAAAKEKKTPAKKLNKAETKALAGRVKMQNGTECLERLKMKPGSKYTKRQTKAMVKGDITKEDVTACLGFTGSSDDGQTKKEKEEERKKLNGLKVQLEMAKNKLKMQQQQKAKEEEIDKTTTRINNLKKDVDELKSKVGSKGGGGRRTRRKRRRRKKKKTVRRKKKRRTKRKRKRVKRKTRRRR